MFDEGDAPALVAEWLSGSWVSEAHITVAAAVILRMGQHLGHDCQRMGRTS
jgi:hypothetical protein